MVSGIPPYPAHLSPAERRAVLIQAARDMASATIKEQGLDRSRVDLDRVEAEAANGITLQWLIERVAALEAKE